MSAAEGFKKMQTFTSNVKKLICHDKIDYVNLRSWMARHHFEDILKDKDLLDSQDFYKHVMQERGSKKYGMKTIVETLANDDLKCFYGMNRHMALGDAETLCRLSHFQSLGARFSSWVVGFQSLVGPIPIPMVKRRTQSVQRFIPG